MNITELKEIWKNEEKVAHIHGWDFSHIHGRYEEEMDLPWDYKRLIVKLSILVDTFCSKISCPMQLAPMNHSIFYV